MISYVKKIAALAAGLPTRMTWEKFVDYAFEQGIYHDLLREKAHSFVNTDKFEEITKDFAAEHDTTLTDYDKFDEDTWHNMYKDLGGR